MDDFKQRVADQVKQEMSTNPLTWWWLSFASPDRPKGDQFLGACIVQAYGVVTASLQAHANKCNPGGQIQATPFPPRVDPDVWANRLLTRDECTEFDRWMAMTYP